MATYQLEPYIKLEHEMVGARWDDEKGKWIVSIKAPSGGHASNGRTGHEPSHVVFEDSADLLFTGIGGLSRWKWPDIEGLHDFKGTLIHSADWKVSEGSESAEDGDGTSGTASDRTDGERTRSKGKTWQEDVKDWGDKKVGVIGVVRERSLPFRRSTLTVKLR